MTTPQSQPTDLHRLVRAIPDFPQPGIVFRDITTLLRDRDGLQQAVDHLHDRCHDLRPDFVAGIEARGFLFGPALALALGVGFVPLRKPGKLPAATHGVEYDLEYGRDRLEIHQDAISPGSRVLVVDDVIATGGTAAAAGQLIHQIEATLVGYGFLIELQDLKGRDRLPDVPVRSVLVY
ncbi:adenine phosphoribosyltransferase [Limnothrix sp. FACHB-708]|uniref:adenine phosphoribosyltransferase n=1 Tax=unclassified Limnothrix TaxID=2632864 RepID=UPI00081EBEFE|nr:MULTISPECIES: adenine phosphoribosyltransferase [unclassified Limnothrix]OCQ90846.1 adenine phosphoribosyltransferase [Limnothrix sp. P13C2]MBD2159351.1 adenine phosphoribosyltransferase [Limnothrix sp. FACHB-1083]MBD2193152.1 adenine phosphoribosyltransferase [Limnothrix sp. FACHB-1088]MBD2552676.1 adenine phosphoribosyltransferase [Limnothrix sp. FACHB-708]MBD2589946.1 adenine phosphoribosyltransferase [Limnothrix sp. FACHB-406]